MLKKLAPLVFLAACVWAVNGYAYEVWLGTHCTPSNAAVYVNTWSNTAARVQGINANLAPCLPTAGTPCANEISCGTAQWKIVFKQFAANTNAITELARSELSRDNTLTNALIHDALTNEVESKFTSAATYGYTFHTLMFYDNALGTTNYNWTTNEVQQIRDYLDSTGRTNVALMYDARNNGVGVRNWCANPLVNHVILEAGADLWFSNAGSRQQLLPWLWTNSATINKKIIFQITPTTDPYGATNNFISTRRLIHWLGATLMDYNFMRSSRVVFMPVTYNGPTMQFYPETDITGNFYTNTMTGLTLSLIEQRNLFEGRTLAPTEADCDNTVRYSASRLDLVGYWNCDEGSGITTHGQYGGADFVLNNGTQFTNAPGAFKDGSLYFAAVDTAVTTNSPDLQMVYDPARGNQTVGMRFSGVKIPPGATVTKAFLQFTAGAGVTNNLCSLNLQTEAADSAVPFQAVLGNLVSRLFNSPNIIWTPPAWLVQPEASVAEQTPELKSALQAVVNRAGWNTSNALAFYVTGSGLRTANSYDSNPPFAPLLHVEWTLDGNGDGIADAWQTTYFGSPSAPNAGPMVDTDGDGLSNLQEYIAGTNPTNSTSKFACRIVQTNGQTQVKFDTIQAAGFAYQGYTRLYDLQYRTNLNFGTWLGVPGVTNILGANTTVTYTNSAASQTRFFRAQVRLQ